MNTPISKTSSAFGHDLRQHGIAIIGMGCRFPGADSPEELWQNLAGGIESIRTATSSDTVGRYFSNLRTYRAGFIRNPFDFDNNYFKIASQEAEQLDPQQRTMLELAVETMRSASYISLANENVGVFLGASQTAYKEMITTISHPRGTIEAIKRHPVVLALDDTVRPQLLEALEEIGQDLPDLPSALVGNITNMIAGRLAHHLDLKGPALVIDTACSSSLVAVHAACESLYTGECKMAFAGGVNLNLTQSAFGYFEAAGPVSKTGKCRPFSRSADGFVLGEGAGLVLLKPLRDALADGDPTLAIIKGSAINNDGRSIGVMAPNYKGQKACLEQAYERFGIDATAISLVEAHGTATRIGDSVEVSTISSFFGSDDRMVSIGSIKSNIGHCLTAAGVAGLIKVVLAMLHKQLPPTLHFDGGNPKWNLSETGLKIQTTLEQWETDYPRIAGVNAFGFGGTNCHVILEEAPVRSGGKRRRPAERALLNRRYFHFQDPYEQENAEHYLYRVAWEKAVPGMPDQFSPELWVFLGENTALFEPLATALREKGARVVQVQPGDIFTRQGEDSFSANQNDENHLRWLFTAFSESDRIGVLLLPERDELDQTARRLKLLYLAVRAVTTQIRIWTVTTGAYAASEKDPVADPYSHAFASMVLGLLAERPEIAGGLIDMDRLALNSEIVADAIGRVQSKPLAIRDGESLTPVLVPHATVSGQKPDRDRNKAVYLIFGGTSGVGLEIAMHLARRGGATIILTGTRDPQAAEELKSLFPDTARTEYRRGSVLDADTTRSIVDEVIERHGSVTGIFLAAGTVSFGSFIEGSDTDRLRTIRTKVQGALNVADALQGRPVEFVSLVSSTSGIFPAFSKGLVAYAAANAFLDAFALKQTNKEIRWFSTSWTLWRNTGMANGADASKFYHLLHGVSASMALKCLDVVLTQDEPHLVVMNPVDAVETDFSLPDRSTQPPPVIHSDALAAPTFLPGEDPLAEALTSTSVAISDLRQYLRSLIAKSVGVEADAIKDDESFYVLGLDSLEAMDLIKDLESKTGRVLNATLLFEHDTIEGLCGYLANGDPAGHTRNLTTRQRELPLLPSQRTFFVSHSFYPDMPSTMVVRLDLNAHFDPDLLGKSAEILVSTHGALRMAFHVNGQGPVQVARETLPDVLISYDFCGRDDSDPLLDQLESEARNHVYTLSEPPAFQIIYVSKDGGRSSLMVCMDHIIADAHSVQLLLQELFDLYTRLFRGDSVDEHRRSGHFERYVRAWEEHEGTPLSTSDEAYWRETLSGADLRIRLPYDNGAGFASEGRSLCEVFALDPAQTAIVVNSAGDYRVTLFQYLLSGYFELLHKLSGQEDLVIRVANENRNASPEEVDAVVGCLADSLPIRVIVPAEGGFAALVERVRTTSLAAHQHPALPSMSQAGMSDARQQRGPSGVSPAGMSFVNLDKFTSSDRTIIDRINCSSALPFSDLSLISWLNQGQLHFSWNYHANHFDAMTVQNFGRQYTSILLANVCELEDSNQSTSETPDVILPKTHLYPETGLLHEKVFLAAAKNSHRIAVRSGNRVLQYKDARAFALRVANALRREILAPDTLVGILAFPSIEAVYGILGILAAPAAFLPIDPGWPDDRIAEILHHGKPKILLIHDQHLPRLASNDTWQTKVEKVLILSDSQITQKEPADVGAVIDWHNEPADKLRTTDVTCSPESLAYVMYTSGTSGAPKGVMVTHRAAAIFLDWISEAFGISEADNFIHTSSLGFGGSIRQIFSTLIAGGTLFPAPRMLLKDPDGLLDFLVDNEITVLNTVPTVWTALLNCIEAREYEGEETALTKLRFLLIGGEAMPVDTVRRWVDRFGPTPTPVNLYGSTETIVNATWHVVTQRPKEGDSRIPIGGPRAGSRVLLLDEKLHHSKPAETGEIWVGGPSIAKGYYLEPALTAERFVNLPDFGGVFYRTGDLAGQNSHGIFEYVGRNDTQVQIYGNRVELSEIENVFLRHEHVAAAAVVEVTAEERQWIIAYVAPTTDKSDLDSSKLRGFIARKLPSYMVPHKIEIMNGLPLNHAGKIDRRALNERARRRVTDLDAPSDDERAISAIWRDVLKVPEVKVHDDFFAMGGDSISVIDVLHRMSERFGQVPKPLDFYRNPTVREIAEMVDQLNQNNGPGQELQSETESRSGGDSFPLSLSQKGFLLAQKMSPDSSPNWCVAIPMTGVLKISFIQRAVDYLIDRHQMLRTVFTAHGKTTVQTVLPPQPFPIPVDDLRLGSNADTDAHVARRFEELAAKVFAADVWPLFALHLILTGSESGYMLVSIHHAIGDAWSLHVLCNELHQLYDAFMNSEQPYLPEISSVYRDVVEYYRKAALQAAPERVEVSKQFWRDAFSSLPVPLCSIQGAEHKAAPEHHHTSHLLAAEEKTAIQVWCKDTGTRPFLLFLTIWARVIHRFTNCAEGMVGVSLSGREIPVQDVGRLFGCFAEGLPLRFSLLEKDLVDQIVTIESVFLASLEHSEPPVNPLVERLLATPGATLSDAYPFFFSYMDFTSLGTYKSPFLSLDLEQAKVHFATDSVQTRWMLGISVSDQIRLNVFGWDDPVRKQQIEDLLQDEVEQLLERVRGNTQIPLRTTSESNSNTPLLPPHADDAIVDSALIAYLPARESAVRLVSAVSPDGFRLEALMDRIFPERLATLTEITETSFGRSGLVFLPRFAGDIATMELEVLHAEVLEAITVAVQHGARSVSLAGILPSRTGYCFDLLEDVAELKGWAGPVRLTSGHAATVVSVAKTVGKVLAAIDIELSNTKLGVVGFGSIGQTSLSLILSSLGGPASITLSDPAIHERRLEQPLEQLAESYKGPVLCSQEGIYDADIVIGAASTMDDILNVNSLKPGAIVIDDSFPSMLNVQNAIRRMDQKKDVLIIGGGQLDVGQTKRSLIDISGVDDIIKSIARNLGDPGFPGCRAESLLAAYDAALPSTHGLVSFEQAVLYQGMADIHGIVPVAFHLEGYTVDEAVISSVREIHGR
jgi:amino acid adenylation domain-containing protein